MCFVLPPLSTCEDLIAWSWLKQRVAARGLRFFMGPRQSFKGLQHTSSKSLRRAYAGKDVLHLESPCPLMWAALALFFFKLNVEDLIGAIDADVHPPALRNRSCKHPSPWRDTHLGIQGL